MNAPPPIGPEEELGWSVFSAKHARETRGRGVPYRVFLTRPGETRISVDRLSVASEAEALSLAMRNAAARGRSFYGWATISVRAARGDGREVVAAPIRATNPHHAVIVLPASAVDRSKQALHAQTLANLAVWKPRPDSGGT